MLLFFYICGEEWNNMKKALKLLNQLFIEKIIRNEYVTLLIFTYGIVIVAFISVFLLNTNISNVEFIEKLLDAIVPTTITFSASILIQFWGENSKKLYYSAIYSLLLLLLMTFLYVTASAAAIFNLPKWIVYMLCGIEFIISLILVFLGRRIYNKKDPADIPLESNSIGSISGWLL